MAYVTQADLEDRYGIDELVQLTDRAVPPSGAIDPAVVARACADATAICDSYARGSYLTPLVAANILVVNPYACMIARWLLHDDTHPEHVEHGYKDAIAWLRDLSSGKVGLPDLTPPGGDSGTPFGVAVSAPVQVFTAATLARMPA